MIKKITTICLAVLMLFGISACNKKDVPATEDGTTILLNAFETHRDLDTMLLYGMLGKVELNTADKEHVFSGEGSAKVTVVANPTKSASPYLFQATDLTVKGEDHTDFGGIGFVTLEVFNAQDTVRRVSIQPVYPETKGLKTWFEAAPKSWTRLSYAVERAIIPLTEASSGDMIRKVTGIDIGFERSETDDVYYIDDLDLYKTEKPVEAVSMKLAEDEICSFDSLWQVSTLEEMSWVREGLRPDFSFVTDVTATGSGGALRLDFPSGRGNYNKTQQWPGICFSQEMLKLVKWDKYDENDSLCFDVYAPESSGVKECWLSLRGPYIGFFTSQPIFLTPGKWQKVSFTVAQLNAQATTDDNFATTQQLHFTAGEEEGGPRVLYIDNFRMEVAA